MKIGRVGRGKRRAQYTSYCESFLMFECVAGETRSCVVCTGAACSVEESRHSRLELQSSLCVLIVLKVMSSSNGALSTGHKVCARVKTQLLIEVFACAMILIRMGRAIDIGREKSVNKASRVKGARKSRYAEGVRP